LGIKSQSFFIAADTLSLDSFTDELGSPTIVIFGNCESRWHSISTKKALIPTTDAENN